jgi:hypothetical protein
MEKFSPAEKNSTMDTLISQKFKLIPLLAQRARTLAAACGLLVALTVPALAQSCVSPPQGLVAWWPLDETGGTVVSDVLGQNPGTASGPIGPIGPPKTVPGFVGNGLNFFFGSKVSINPSPSLDFGTNKNFTIDAWIKGRNGPILGNYKIITNIGYFVYISNTGTLSLQMGNGTPLLTWSGPAIPVATWTFIAVVIDRTNQTVTLYTAAPGSGLVKSGPFTIPNPNTVNASSGLPLLIGGCPGNPNGCDTIIDEVEIFNRPLSQSELQSIVDAGSAGKCQQKTKGMTWIHSASNAQTGTISVGCNGCNATQGDTACTQQLPLLCIYKPTPSFPLPTGVSNADQYNQWSGGVVATTAPVAGNTFMHSTDATNYCIAQFSPGQSGSGWRVAEFHDGWGWNFQAYGGTVKAPTVPSTRFWVHINDQPAANCWQTP